MTRKPWLLALLSAALVWTITATPAVVHAVTTTAGVRSSSQARGPDRAVSAHWVDTWTAMPQLTEPGNMPPAPFTGTSSVLVDATLRQTIHVTLGGRQVRIEFSNAFGGTDLPITKAIVALPAGGQAGVSGLVPGSARALTFGGRSSITVPVGAQVVSDPVAMDVAPLTNLSVSMYLAQGQASTNITSHPGSRTTSYLLAGDHTTDSDLPGATAVDHWYFISAAEVAAPRRAAGVAILGDSLTDGRGSTTNGNDRWPDDLAARLQEHPATREVPVLNQAAGGNCVLHDPGQGCLGPNAVGRLDRDVLSQPGRRWLIVFEGVNDIGTAAATPAAQQQVAQDLITAYEQIITQAHASGVRVYGATITPFGGNSLYDDPQGLRQQTREQVNRWIRTSGWFDAVLDFDRVVRDPANPGQILPAYDSGDHLHLNPQGYRALAASVPLRLFTNAADSFLSASP
ncbi:MAG: SGNH/GDSL hydrolase family protein [Solirubrobacterales bacterium]|nr:SGNH/GDSL hydrolase family protein [Solirubrobacterales bacterium]